MEGTAVMPMQENWLVYREKRNGLDLGHREAEALERLDELEGLHWNRKDVMTVKVVTVAWKKWREWIY